MSLKTTLLGQRWLTGFSTAAFVFAGFSIGRGESILGLGIGVLATAFLAIGDAQGRKETRENALKMSAEAYEAGLAHGQRHTSMR
jgi:hypothetical protein